MSKTDKQYEAVIKECEDIFLKKTRDYGTAWRVLRAISIIDQIYIKAQRIRNVQETGHQKVENIGDDIRSEFIGIINYSIIYHFYDFINLHLHLFSNYHLMQYVYY